MPFATTLTKLGGIMLSEFSQNQEQKLYDLICGILKKKKEKTYRSSKYNNSCQRQNVETQKMDKGGQKVPTYSYKNKQVLGCNMHHGDHT